MDWSNPEERLALAERVGIDEYNRLFLEHVKDSEIGTVAGHPIRVVSSMFGRLFAVGDTKVAFETIAQACEYALANPAQGRG